MEPVLLLRSKDGNPPPSPWDGNLFLMHMMKANIHWCTPEQYKSRNEIMANMAKELTEKGKTPYIIPEGGSCALGLW